MTFGRFVYRNAFRNKRRTALTILSVGFSLFLLILLTTFLDFLKNPPGSEEGKMRLVVSRSTAFVDQLPMSYLDKIKAVPHVEHVSPTDFFPASYKESKNFFPCLAVDPAEMWSVFHELKTDEAAKKAFLEQKSGAIVGVALMQKFGWKVGDTVTLLGQFQPVDLEFKIVGTYTSEIHNVVFYIRYDYLNEAMGKTNTVSAFWLTADNLDAIPEIAHTIDAMFHNSPAETKTDTEQAFRVGFSSMLGNLRLLFGSIATVVVFTMLLVTASTMGMTVRERYREVGILKAMGYTRQLVLWMILGEAGFIALLGGALGCVVAYSLNFLNLYKLTAGFIEKFPISLTIYGSALAVGFLIGIFSGLWPALMAARLTITEAIRRVG